MLAAVGDGIRAADECVSGSREGRTLRRLIGRNAVELIAFTPTDASHVLGGQSTHDAEPACRAAAVLARRSTTRGRPVATSAEAFATAVVEAMVGRSAEAVLAAALERDGIEGDEASSPLARAAFDRLATTARLVVGLDVPLVGVGAPAPVYAPAVAGRLSTEAIVPDRAAVANAIGAVVGRVRVRRLVVVTSPRRGTFRVHAAGEPVTVPTREEAEAAAIAAARRRVADEMDAAGAPVFDIEVRWDERTAEVEGRELFVEGTATAIGTGRPRLP
ncbi:MAG: hypothetical protein R2695_06850 [Acidimicrobiales bacterium]